MIIIAFAIAVASGQATTAAAAAPAKEKKICRMIENTGSIMGTRACHTKDEWAKIDAEHQRSMDNYHDRSGGRGGVDGGS